MSRQSLLQRRITRARSMRCAAASAMRLLQLASMPPPSIAGAAMCSSMIAWGCLLATTPTRWATQQRIPWSDRTRGGQTMGTWAAAGGQYGAQLLPGSQLLLLQILAAAMAPSVCSSLSHAVAMTCWLLLTASAAQVQCSAHAARVSNELPAHEWVRPDTGQLSCRFTSQSLLASSLRGATTLGCTSWHQPRSMATQTLR